MDKTIVSKIFFQSEIGFDESLERDEKVKRELEKFLKENPGKTKYDFLNWLGSKDRK